jgi:C-terminal processing protease CtpA/Prc
LGNQSHLHLAMARRLPAALFLCLLATFATGQTVNPASAKLNRERGLAMLSEIKEIIKAEYYDPQFHGIDIEQHFKTASARIKELDTNSRIFTVIAQVLLDFNDSHTGFLPPNRSNRVEYGFSLQMIGDACYVVEVKHGSDAETQGLKVGEVIIGINGFAPHRKTLWTLMYFLYALDPQPGITLTLRSIDGRTRQVSIRARILTPSEQKQESNQRKELEKQRPELKSRPYKCREVSADLIACKLYTFEIETDVVDKMMKEVVGHKKLILDLRGNVGGAVLTEQHLTGYFFDHDVKIGDEVARKNTREEISRSHKNKAFLGELVVLIDSLSASAAECFARVVQIEKRGQVIGDASAGAVMESRLYALGSFRGGANWEAYSFYGAVSVTVRDFVMSDGQRLEGTGVIPDLMSVPTGQNLAEKTDPVLAYAVGLCGGRITPEEAGKYYFLARVPEAGEDDIK